MKTFREYISEGQLPYTEKQLLKPFKKLGKVSVPRNWLDGFDLHIQVENKKALTGLEKEATKIATSEFGALLNNKGDYKNGAEVQSPWSENKNDEDDKPWELMINFKYRGR